jgi:hypothetical protein
MDSKCALLVAWAAVSFANLAMLAPTVGAEPFPTSTDLQRLVTRAIVTAQEKLPKVQSNHVAVTLVDLRHPAGPRQASHRGGVQIYPASVVKMFYLAAAHQWLEVGRLADTPELRRAMRDMIVESYNEATHYVIDLLTDTTSGPELTDSEIDAWFEKRNAVNRYFASLGYANVVAHKKPWCEGPYGRESQSIRRHKPSRNMLSTDDTARLLVEIATGKAVSARHSAEMLELMKRNPLKPLEAGGEPDQGNAFSGLGLRHVPGAKLWSKAGWTSQVRHDAAYIELPSGTRFVLVIFTEGHSNERDIIGSIARTVVDEMNTPGEQP